MKMNLTLLALSISFCSFSVSAQWAGTTGDVTNTNAGAVSIVRNAPSTQGQVFVVNPKGQGSMIIGEANTGAGGYTSLTLGISAASAGYSYLQSIKSAGSSYGSLILNESGGNVGIGTISTSDVNYKLFVETGIRTRKIRVDMDTWPDYVFSPLHKRLSILELENYINKHSHLPGVPSSAEVEKSGLDLGEGQRILMEKIEELTLYVIELKKENEEIKKQVKKIGTVQ